MDADAFDYAMSSLGMLEVAAMVYETGYEHILEDLSEYCFIQDEEYEFATNGIHGLCDFVGENYDENNEINSLYFSSEDMMDYYRLCRELSKLCNIPLKKCPYMQRAETTVREWLFQLDCYYCNYRLQTKINHKWASGIVFQYDASYFYEYLALFSRLLYVFSFYSEMVKELRLEVEAMKRQQAVLTLPLNSENERSAA